MNILLINHFPLAGSGSGTYTKNLAVCLAERGHRVRIILPENTEDFDRIPGVELIPVYFSPEDGSTAPAGALPFNFPCFTTHPRSTFSFGDMRPEEIEAYIGSFKRALQGEITRDRPDVIHGQHIWILSSLASDEDIPLLITAHGTDLMGYDRWPDLRHFADHAVAASSAVITISRDNSALVEERFPDAKDKIIFMRNGYDPSVFYPEELQRESILGAYGMEPKDLCGRRIVIFAGKLTYAKGVDVLLEAVSTYEKIRSDTLTLIVGDGEEMAALRALAADLSLKTVHFLGNVDQDSLRKLYDVSDLAVVPSRKEAFGLVALEAMACGLPVIATDQGGLPDFVNDSVGALVLPEDPADLAAAVSRILDRLEGSEAGEWKSEIHYYARESYAQDRIIHELEELSEIITK